MWGVVSEEEHRSRFWTSPTYSSFKIEIAPNFTAWKVYIFGVFPLRKILKFHLIFWCGRFVGKSPKTLPKLCVSTKFSHQGIRWISVFYAVFLVRLFLHSDWIQIFTVNLHIQSKCLNISIAPRLSIEPEEPELLIYYLWSKSLMSCSGVPFLDFQYRHVLHISGNVCKSTALSVVLDIALTIPFCADDIPWNFLKAVFHKIYLVHSWILGPIFIFSFSTICILCSATQISIMNIITDWVISFLR